MSQIDVDLQLGSDWIDVPTLANTALNARNQENLPFTCARRIQYIPLDDVGADVLIKFDPLSTTGQILGNGMIFTAGGIANSEDCANTYLKGAIGTEMVKFVITY